MRPCVRSVFTVGGWACKARWFMAVCLLGACAGHAAAGQSPGAAIVGGEISGDEAWPWQISVLEAQESGGATSLSHFCGATRLSTEWAVTAAHCFYGDEDEISDPSEPAPEPDIDTDPYRVLLDTNSLGGDLESLLHIHSVVMKVEEVIIHEDNHPSTLDHAHDIALIRFDPDSAEDPQAAAALSDATVDLNGPAVEALLAAPGRETTAIGWGMSEEGSSTVNLREVALTFVPFDDCNEAHGNSLVDSITCAGPPGVLDDDAEEVPVKAHCQGDSGGPWLVRAGDDYWLQTAVISFGSGCATPALSGAGRVSEYLDWIEGHTGLDLFTARPPALDVTAPAHAEALSTVTLGARWLPNGGVLVDEGELVQLAGPAVHPKAGAAESDGQIVIGRDFHFQAPEVTEATDLVFELRAANANGQSNVLGVTLTVYPEGEAPAAPESESSGGGGSSGSSGCTVGSGEYTDPVLPLLILLALVWIVYRARPQAGRNQPR